MILAYAHLTNKAFTDAGKRGYATALVQIFRDKIWVTFSLNWRQYLKWSSIYRWLSLHVKFERFVWCRGMMSLKRDIWLNIRQNAIHDLMILSWSAIHNVLSRILRFLFWCWCVCVIHWLSYDLINKLTAIFGCIESYSYSYKIQYHIDHVGLNQWLNIGYLYQFKSTIFTTKYSSTWVPYTRYQHSGVKC